MAGGAALGPVKTANYAHLVDNRPWWKNSRIVVLNLWVALLLITSSTNGFDGSMMNGLQSLEQWNKDFDYPKGGMLGLLNAIQNIGCLAAYPIAPYLADGLGRRASILFGVIVMIGATILQTASNSVGMFIGARFLIGFGLTFAAAAAPLLVAEIAYPTQRAQLTSMYNTLWYLGSIIAAWSTFGTFNIHNSWSWRIPSAIQGLPSVIQLALIWFMPESPRWLQRKGKEAKALKTLAYYHARGDANDPLVQLEYEEIKAALAFEREVAANVGWKSLFKTPGNRRRMRIIIALAFFSQWSGNGLVSYYLNKVFNAIGITNPTTQLLVNGLLMIMNFIVAIVAGFLCDKVGRRRLFMISTVGMFIFWSCQTICFAVYTHNHSEQAAHAVVAFIFLYYAAYDIAFTPLIVSYTLEILPYQLRAKGFAVFNFTISLSLIFNQYVNPIALEKIGWYYYLVYVIWLIFEAVFCYLFVVETKNHTLEETAALFDGEDTVAQIKGKGTEAANREIEHSGNLKSEVRVDHEKMSSEGVVSHASA